MSPDDDLIAYPLWGEIVELFHQAHQLVHGMATRLFAPFYEAIGIKEKSCAGS